MQKRAWKREGGVVGGIGRNRQTAAAREAISLESSVCLNTVAVSKE